MLFCPSVSLLPVPPDPFPRNDLSSPTLPYPPACSQPLAPPNVPLPQVDYFEFCRVLIPNLDIDTSHMLDQRNCE
eukprot:4547969-Prymnesium_polylepis.1